MDTLKKGCNLFWNRGNPSPGDSSLQQATTGVDALFQSLEKKCSDPRYQDALKVMQGAPTEYLDAFTTIMQQHNCDQKTQHQTPAHVQPAPASKPIKVHLIITGQTHGAHQQFLDQLNSRGSKVTPTDNLQESKVILIFCPVLSRVRSDVEAAIRMIPDGAQGKPVVLVMMHHYRKPDQILKQTQWMDTFPCITLSIDVLFHETMNGLLQCTRNQEAVLTIQSMCDSYRNEKKSSQPVVQTKAKTEIDVD